jgi:UDP:flavonoid glycosyltransferase YjiC (YdhE family)
MSKRVFLGFSGGMGPFIRCAELSIKLKEMGWICGFYSIDESAVPMLKLGFERVSITGRPSNAHMVLRKGNKWKYSSELWGLYGYYDLEYLKGLWQAWENGIMSFKPDLIIADLSIPSVIAGRINHIPTVAVTQACYHPSQESVRYWDDDSIHPDSKSIDENILKNMNLILESSHVKPLDSFNHAFLGDITVIPSFEEFDPINYPEKPFYGGLMLWENNIESSKNTIKNSDKKKIFIYLGRVSDSSDIDTAKIIRDLLIFAQKNKAYEFIFTSAGFFSLQEISQGVEIPDNAILVDQWLPLSYLKENVSLIIHHGGHGSCMASFKYGIPAIIIPTHSEREFNARAMERLGAGKMLLVENYTEGLLLEYLNELLYNDTYKLNIMHMKNEIALRKYSGVTGIIEKINSLFS